MDLMLIAAQVLAQAQDNTLPVAIVGVIGTFVSLVLAPVVQKLVTGQGKDRDRLSVAIDYIVELHEGWGQAEPPPIPAELLPRPRRTTDDLSKLLRRRTGDA